MCDQITELEQRVWSNHVQRLEKEKAYLKDKVDDAENRSVRVIFS